MITFKHKGDFKNTERFFTGIKKVNYMPILIKYGQRGVVLLASATPVKSGLTANSWTYEAGGNKKYFWISWSNTNIQTGASIAILLQYGHVTGTGGFVQGHDYINPVIQPLFDELAENIWKEVTNL